MAVNCPRVLLLLPCRLSIWLLEFLPLLSVELTHFSFPSVQPLCSNSLATVSGNNVWAREFDSSFFVNCLYNFVDAVHDPSKYQSLRSRLLRPVLANSSHSHITPIIECNKHFLPIFQHNNDLPWSLPQQRPVSWQHYWFSFVNSLSSALPSINHHGDAGLCQLIPRLPQD